MHYTIRIIDIIGTLSYIFFLVAYMFRNMLYLRAMTIVASTLNIFYCYYVSNNPVWVGIQWETLSNIVNVVMIILILRDKNELYLTEEEQHIYELRFTSTSSI